MSTRSAWTHGAAVTAAAASGALVTGPGTAWYRDLSTPPWQPPGAAFGPVWTTLYALIGFAGDDVWNRTDGDARRRCAAAWGANLLINAGWTWTFFGAHRLRLAVVHAALIELSTLDLIRRAWPVSRRAAVTLVPYAIWSGFATALSADIARRNR